MTEPARLSDDLIRRYHNDARFHALVTAVARRLVQPFGLEHQATAAAIEIVDAVQSAADAIPAPSHPLYLPANLIPTPFCPPQRTR